MHLPELSNDFVIKRLQLQPVGEHQWAQLDPNDPDQFNLYQNSTYTLLLRSHILGVYSGPDAFEIYLLKNGQILFHEDVLEEDMNKSTIRTIIRLFNDAC